MRDQISEQLEMADAPQPMTNASTEQTQDVGQRLQREIAECERVQGALDASIGEFQDFVRVASHDLREPLRKITSFGLLLKESLEGKLEGEDRENLEFMVDGARRMTRMLEDLLTYSRLNARVIKPETVDLNQLVEQLKGIELAELLEETGGTIEIPQSLPKVQADPVLVKMLLQNLVVNGIQYCGKDILPQISMRVGRLADGKVTIGVQDNGIGIDEKYHEHIFKIFTRLQAREEGAGTGTGLAICKKILDKHGGRFEVDSHVGTGSTFWLTLPAATRLEQEQDRLVSSASARLREQEMNAFSPERPC